MPVKQSVRYEVRARLVINPWSTVIFYLAPCRRYANIVHTCTRHKLLNGQTCSHNAERILVVRLRQSLRQTLVVEPYRLIGEILSCKRRTDINLQHTVAIVHTKLLKIRLRMVSDILGTVLQNIVFQKSTHFLVRQRPIAASHRRNCNHCKGTE